MHGTSRKRQIVEQVADSSKTHSEDDVSQDQPSPRKSPHSDSGVTRLESVIVTTAI